MKKIAILGSTGSIGTQTLDIVREQGDIQRSEEHTSELQSQGTISYAVFCLKKKKANVYRKYLDAETGTVVSEDFLYTDRCEIGFNPPEGAEIVESDD